MAWSELAGGIGKLIEKLTTYIPGKVEKLKNERQRLEIEKIKLVKGKWDEKKSRRVEQITARINTITELLDSKISD